MNRNWWAVLMLLIVLTGCAGTKAYRELGNVTTIEIKRDQDGHTQIISEPMQIAQIIAYVDAQRSGWGANDWAGVPVPQVSLHFYDQERFKGHFGIGNGFFVTQREGDFASKSISVEEQQKFLDLIDVSEETIQP